MRLTAEPSPWPIRPFWTGLPRPSHGHPHHSHPHSPGTRSPVSAGDAISASPSLGFASASALNMLFSLLLLLTPLPISAQPSLPKRCFSNFSNEVPGLRHTSKAPAGFPSWKHLHIVWYGCWITSVYLAEEVAPRGKNHVCLCVPLHFQGLMYCGS